MELLSGTYLSNTTAGIHMCLKGKKKFSIKSKHKVLTWTEAEEKEKHQGRNVPAQATFLKG